jgi:hypothetical protein
MNKTFIKRFGAIVILPALIAGYVATEIVLMRRAAPPATVTDFNSFLNWQPGTQELILLDLPSGEYLMAVGPFSGLFPSGPSAYVFDRSGRLVDRSSDIGDAPRFNERWHAQRFRGTGKRLSPSEASQWVKSATTTAD